MTTAPSQILNPWGWPLPLTDEWIYGDGDYASPYEALTDPAEQIAERLTMLAHRTFNDGVWGKESGRLENYWGGFSARLRSSTNQRTVAQWWSTFIDRLRGVDLSYTPLLHEKNLLCRPSTLTGGEVEDADVLMVMRTQHRDLANRTQLWVAHYRQAKRNNVTITSGSGVVDLADLAS